MLCKPTMFTPLLPILFSLLDATILGDKAPGLALTPPMGWMSWERFRCETDCVNHPNECISEDLYKTMAQHLKEDGYLDAGYNQISIDDCWEASTRDANGKLTANATRFPSGMAALADHIHSLGLGFGIYSDEGYEEIDAETFAQWGVDYLKLDGCYNDKDGYVQGYPAMGKALAKSGRNITYSCSWPAYLGDNETAKDFGAMVEAGCNLWRNWDDIDNSWSSVVSIMDHWGDYDMDMILVGDDHYGKMLSIDEAKSQFAIWSICASPLIMSNDLRTVPDEYREILLNKDVIAVNQDPLGKQGLRLTKKGDHEVWYRELSPLASNVSRVAVALLNKLGNSTATLFVTPTDVGAPAGKSVEAMDLFSHVPLGVLPDNFLEANVPAHGVVMVELAWQN